MATLSRISERSAPKDISHIRANAITLSSAKNIIHQPSMDELYEMALAQPSTVRSDVPMADPLHAGLSPEHNRVLVSYTGQDTARSSWARLLAPQPEELQRYPELVDTRDRIERLVREMNFQMMQQQKLIHATVFFSKSGEFMGKIHLIVPQQYAKLAFDLNLNFIRITPETEAIYARSKHLPISDIWLICHPEWVNPSWQAWRNRVTPADTAQIARDPEPKRIMMVFDTAYSTSYLLGARYFGEVKKACLTMIWDAAIKADIGMPIHGSSKTIFTRNLPTPASTGVTENTPSESAENPAHEHADAPLKPTTFITIGLSGSGKSTLGNDAHQGFLDPALGERSRIGNDDALIILYQPNDPEHGTIGLEDSCYNKSNDYTPDSIYINTVQSAENVMCYRDEHGKLSLIHQDVLCGNGRVQTARHLLPGADHQLDTPSPDFIALLMKDETLPPILRITNPQLMVSMYMCLTTRSSSAENIPIAQMNQLRMVPGANPFNTWGMEREAEALEKLLQHIGCQGIVLNTGSFFINQELHLQGKHRKITKEISLAMYPLLARNKIRWEPWSFFPGTEIPVPGAFDDLFPEFDAHFHPHRSQDEYAFREILRKRLLARLDFLLEIKIDRRFILPIRKAIYELDTYEQSTRGPIGHVDNLETLRGTGREDKLSF